MTYYQDRTSIRIANNKCITCGKREPMPDRQRCGVCAEAHGDQFDKLRAKREALGLCARHGNPSIEGLKGCPRCRLEFAAKAKKRKEIHAIHRDDSQE